MFQSAHHPGEASLALVLARAQAQPVAVALLAVFVVAFAAMLQGVDVLGTVVWAVPLAYAAAVAWTVYALHRKPAEIILRGGFGAVRSVWDVAWAREHWDAQVRLAPVFRPFKKEGHLHVGIGDMVHTLQPEAWPRYSALLDALRATSDDLAAVAT